MYSLATLTTESPSGSPRVIAASVGPYRVIDKLGSGGMGEVYLAEDTRLGRKVALKTVSGGGSPEARSRLRHEARAAAALNHPNIAAIYDVIEDASEMYIVMEYVEGATLAQRIRYGPMIAEEALEIGAQVLEALDHAHAHGVVHHDLKPANVSLAPGGKVKILDFGIARVHPRMVDATRDTTGVGRVFGTPGYSAPEQLVGAVGDHRSDLYSVGVLLYELIAGRPPFEASDLLEAAMSAAAGPPALADVAPHAPPAIGALVAKAMAPDPGARFQSASEMLAAVRQLIPEAAERPTLEGAAAPAIRTGKLARWARTAAVVAAATALVVLAGLPLARYWRNMGRVTVTDPVREPVIAVLPLQNRSTDRSLDFYGDGFADTLTMALLQIKGPVVLSRAVVLEAIRRNRDPRRVAADLGAAYLVDGSIQPLDQELQVTLQLVARDGRLVWSNSYTAASNELLSLHRIVALGIVRGVRETLGGRSVDEVPTPGTSNANALTAYWKGRSVLDRAASADAVTAAIADFQRAVDLDPGFALGHAGLAEGHWQKYQLVHDEALPRQALEASLKALQLAPDQPAVIVAAATVYNGLGQSDEAVRILRGAQQDEPSNENVQRVLSKALLASGRTDEGLRLLEDATRANPASWRNYFELGMARYQLRRLPEAADALSRALELNPNDPRLLGNLGTTYAQMWDNERAVDNFERANQLVPSRMGFANIGTVRYRLGQYEEARQAFEQAIQLDSNYPTTHYSLGDTYMRLGRAADARREYEKALALGLEALEVNERDAETVARVAVFEAKLGRLDQAAARIDQAVALAPNLPEVHYKRAVVNALRRDQSSALQALERALALGFSAREAREDFDLVPLRGTARYKALVGAR